MRHVNYTSKPVTIDHAKPRVKPYALTDGGGLRTEVLPSGSKVWRFKDHLTGKREMVTVSNRAAQRRPELPGMTRTLGQGTQRARPEPNRGPDMSGQGHAEVLAAGRARRGLAARVAPARARKR